MSKFVCCYLPVLHRGYINFFQKHSEGSKLFIFGKSLIEEFDYLSKDIRSLDPQEARLAVSSLNLFEEVEILEEEFLQSVFQPGDSIVMPDDEIHRLLSKRLAPPEIFLDRVFLRWGKENSVEKKAINSSFKVSSDDRDIFRMWWFASNESEKSSDWWRQVGAAVLREGEPLITSYNRHVPSEYEPYFSGDPRSNFKKGINIEISTALHAEAGIIARSAKEGISLLGLDLYVTTFPCPPCAKLVAYSGIKRLFFQDGYSLLDGETILRSQNVEIIRVV